MPMFAIVGLGNPGSEYETTRHNIGFKFIDFLAKEWSVSFMNDSKMNALFAKTTFEGNQIVLIKPQTFMNNSGESVVRYSTFFKLNPNNIIVIYDDINLEPGQIKLSQGGSAGGHNGIKSLQTHCGNDFIRVRIGIGGKKFPEQPLSDFVLGKITQEENELFNSKTENIINCIESLLKNGLAFTQNFINRKK